MAKKAAEKTGWTPPANAQPVELAEFHKFQTVGEVCIGRIERVTSRPDPNHAEKIMRGLVMSPVVLIDTKGNRQAYRNLAIGLSAHLGLLIGDPSQQKGQAFAFVYDGTRASGPGKAASHQFNVYRLSVQEFRDEVVKTDARNAELLLSGERAAQDELFPGDDDQSPAVAAKKQAASGAGSGKPSSPRQSFQDWRRVPGPAKQYRNVKTGETLSNRQYRQQFLYQGKTLETVQAARGQPRDTYNRLLRARRDYLTQHGVTANLQDVRRSADMKSIVRDLKRTKSEYHRLTKGGRTLTPAERRRLYGPDSAAARALVDLGYRDPNAKHWVGDS